MILIALRRKDGTEEGVQPEHISRYWMAGNDSEKFLCISFLNGDHGEYRETAERLVELIRSAAPVTKYV